jgi:dihydrofolate reductase
MPRAVALITSIELCRILDGWLFTSASYSFPVIKTKSIALEMRAGGSHQPSPFGGKLSYSVAMTTFDLVVAADDNWGIGKSNGLPWPKLRGDLQHFRRITSTIIATTNELPTSQNAVIMGRKTWQSVEVAQRPLPRRINCVVSRGDLTLADGVLTAHSLPQAIALCAHAASIFVIGGAELYRAALQQSGLRYIYLTRVHGDFHCDTAIPNLDVEFVPSPWPNEIATEENGIRYQISRLTRRLQT